MNPKVWIIIIFIGFILFHLGGTNCMTLEKQQKTNTSMYVVSIVLSGLGVLVMSFALDKLYKRAVCDVKELRFIPIRILTFGAYNWILRSRNPRMTTAQTF